MINETLPMEEIRSLFERLGESTSVKSDEYHEQKNDKEEMNTEKETILSPEMYNRLMKDYEPDNPFEKDPGWDGGKWYLQNVCYEGIKGIFSEISALEKDIQENKEFIEESEKNIKTANENIKKYKYKLWLITKNLKDMLIKYFLPDLDMVEDLLNRVQYCIKE